MRRLPALAERDSYNVLCIDGVGFRSLSGLFMLNHILETAMHNSVSDSDQDVPPQAPYEFFDLICGTSSGALLAILFGCLKMRCDEALEVYERVGDLLCKDEDDNYWPFHQHNEEKITAVRELLNDVITKNAAKPHLKKGPTTNGERETGCFTFITTVSCRTHALNILRTYPQPRGEPPSFPSNHEWLLDQAVLAAISSSAEPFSVVQGRSEYKFQDACIRFSNPAMIAYKEAQVLFPSKRPHVFLSLGAGLPDLFGKSDETWQEKLGGIVTETERTHHDLSAQLQKNNDLEAYFRLNVSRGVGNLRRADLFSFAEVEEVVNQLMATDLDLHSRILSCANRLETLVTRAPPLTNSNARSDHHLLSAPERMHSPMQSSRSDGFYQARHPEAGITLTPETSDRPARQIIDTSNVRSSPSKYASDVHQSSPQSHPHVIHVGDEPEAPIQGLHLQPPTATATVFMRLMYSIDRGLAMWRPSPCSVGDVGFIHDGKFHRYNNLNILESTSNELYLAPIASDLEEEISRHTGLGVYCSIGTVETKFKRDRSVSIDCHKLTVTGDKKIEAALVFNPADMDQNP